MRRDEYPQLTLIIQKKLNDGIPNRLRISISQIYEKRQYTKYSSIAGYIFHMSSTCIETVASLKNIVELNGS